MQKLFTELKQIIDEMNTAATAMGFFPITLAGKGQPSARAKVNKNALKEKKVHIKEENIMEEIIASMLEAGVSEAVVEEILDMVDEEFISERNKENRAKKEKWENKTNKLPVNTKRYNQRLAKNLGDAAKEDRECGKACDAQGGRETAPNIAAYWDDRARFHFNNANIKDVDKADIIKRITQKLGTRVHSFHDPVRGYTEEK